MNIENEVKNTIKKYKLANKTEKIVVALSGGKDSTSVLYIMKKLGYNIEGLMIDLNLGEWSKIHNEKMKKFCQDLNVKLTIVDLKQELGQGICFIKSVLKKEKNLTGCTVCGIIKRWILNKWAKKLHANKLVTGHNLDDETQNVLMNFLKGNILLGVNSSPATGGVTSLKKPVSSPNQSDKFFHERFTREEKKNISPEASPVKNKKFSTDILDGFVQRIKPLFFVPEDEIRNYAKNNNFDILYDKCPCAFGTYRVETRGWMKNITDDEKKKIVENFQKLVPKLRKENPREIFTCKKCGEPCRGEICNACKIFECIN